MSTAPLTWHDNRLTILDQTRIPWEEVHLDCRTHLDVAKAIKEMRIRGAPAIGVAAGYGMALAALNGKEENTVSFIAYMARAADDLICSRPTAVNLVNVVDRIRKVVAPDKRVAQLIDAIVRAAVAIHEEEREATRLVSVNGAELIKDNATILTHCNAGELATAGFGTALGVIVQAQRQGKNIKVFATETRPLLQGARLTTWELAHNNVPVTLITDSMAGYVMHKGLVDCVIVGADRIALNGDTANKIGTYTLAVLATENGLPFYVAAPVSTIDPCLASGEGIPIEERDSCEVTCFMEKRIVDETVGCLNPAFDVTPNLYISAIVTEKGIIMAPYEKRLRQLAGEP